MLCALNPKDQPLPGFIAAVWGAFLYEGLMTSTRNRQRRQDVMRHWDGSPFQLLQECCRYLERIWLHSRSFLPQLSRSDGSYEHEVIAHFGELLGYHLILNEGRLPDDDEADALIRDLVNRYRTENSRASPITAPDKSGFTQ